jgi:hypothetical protein
MAKVGLSKLNLNKKQDIKVIQFEGNDIEIIQYLDIASKSSLVSAAVRGSVIGGIVDEILLDAYLHLFIIDKYTNISLTQKQRDNLLDTFDILESNFLWNKEYKCLNKWSGVIHCTPKTPPFWEIVNISNLFKVELLIQLF